MSMMRPLPVMMIMMMSALPLAACQTSTGGAAPVAVEGQPVPLTSVDKQDLQPVNNTDPNIPLNGSLEKRVESLERQMRDAQPTLKKVDAMETHFKTLSLELGKITETYVQNTKGEAPSVAPSKEPKDIVKESKVESKKESVKEPKKASVSKDVAAVGASLSVVAVRIGEQPKGITRIVLDTTRATEIRYDLDNGEKLLVIDVPKAAWKGQSSSSVRSALVKSYRATDDKDGTHLVIELKQTARVVATARLSPDHAKGHGAGAGNRVYVDIASAK